MFQDSVECEDNLIWRLLLEQVRVEHEPGQQAAGAGEDVEVHLGGGLQLGVRHAREDGGRRGDGEVPSNLLINYRVGRINFQLSLNLLHDCLVVSGVFIQRTEAVNTKALLIKSDARFYTF